MKPSRAVVTCKGCECTCRVARCILCPLCQNWSCRRCFRQDKCLPCDFRANDPRWRLPLEALR